MRDEDCLRFLRQVLPRLSMRWPGFRKVRAQVCKRLQRRIAALELPDLDAYRVRLASVPAEWEVLDNFLRITISRFYRDRRTFEELAAALPELHQRARLTGAGRFRIWSAGCASGEEPYTLALLYRFCLPGENRLPLEIIATDLAPEMLERARSACYEASSLRELPRRWLETAFQPDHGQKHCLLPRFRAGVRLIRQDLREEAPAGPFQLVACRYLAFTYFAEPLQRKVLDRIAAVLEPGGLLVLGNRESLPPGQEGFGRKTRNLYQKES